MMFRMDTRTRGREGPGRDGNSPVGAAARRLQRGARLEQRQLRGAGVPAGAAELRLRQPRVRGRILRGCAQRGVGGAAEREDGLARRHRGRRQRQPIVPVAEALDADVQGRHRAVARAGVSKKPRLENAPGVAAARSLASRRHPETLTFRVQRHARLHRLLGTHHLRHSRAERGLAAADCLEAAV